MNILKRSLAPITDKAWEQINLESERIIKEFTTGRKFADISGPLGTDYGAVSTGRLVMPANQPKEGVQYGIRDVIPLVEVRKTFSLDRWELDNASRGATDLDMKNLQKAAKQMALFEDSFLYQGFDALNIQGMEKAVTGRPKKVKLNHRDFIRALQELITSMKQQAVEGPYTLVIPDKAWMELVAETHGYPLPERLRKLLDCSVITHHYNDKIFLVSKRGGDIELILGEDISLGYEGHDNKSVQLYFSEAFTYRILSTEAIRVIAPAYSN